jgi:hypothetical protein
MPSIETNDVAFAQWARRVQDTNNEHFVEAKTSQNYSRPDHRTRIDRWKENLNREDIKSVVPMLQMTAETFGYSLNSSL